MLLTNGAPLSGGGWNADAQLFNVSTGAAMVSTGIPAGLRAGTPVFSPDGKHVAFNFYGGTVNGTAADRVSLAAMDFDPKSSTFSNFRVLYKPAAGAGTAVCPTFMPTNDAVVFELETVNNGRDWGGTARRATPRAPARTWNAGRALVGRPRDAHGDASRRPEREGLPADTRYDAAHERRDPLSTSRR